MTHVGVWPKSKPKYKGSDLIQWESDTSGEKAQAFLGSAERFVRAIAKLSPAHRAAIMDVIHQAKRGN